MPASKDIGWPDNTSGDGLLITIHLEFSILEGSNPFGQII